MGRRGYSQNTGILVILVGLDNGLLPVRHQAIICTIAGTFLIGTFAANFSEILIKTQKCSYKKIFWNIVYKMC